MVNRIELIIWTDYDRYEQDCLFLSREEASDLIGQLNRAITDLDAFLLAPPIAGKGEAEHKSIDVTALMEYLGLMIAIANKLAEQQPYPDGIRKLRDAAKRELDAAWAAVRAGG